MSSKRLHARSADEVRAWAGAAAGSRAFDRQRATTRARACAHAFMRSCMHGRRRVHECQCVCRMHARTHAAGWSSSW